MADTDESTDTTTEDNEEQSAEPEAQTVDPALTINKDTLKIAAGAILAIVIVVLLGAVIANNISEETTRTGAFATVNGENITYDDLTERRGVLAALGRQPQADQTLKELLIDEALLIDAAEQRGLLPSTQNISDSVNELLTSNNVNRSRYEQRLQQQGLNWSNLLTYYQQRQGISAVIDELGPNESVTEEELRRVYEENRENFELPRRMQVRHILLTEPDTGDSTESLARRLLDQARNGSDFCDLVDEYSDDPGSQDNCGRYNVSRNSQFVQPFIDAAFNMTEGEYQLVNSSFGYHVMVKDGELAPETRSFEAVRDQIRQQYQRQQEVNVLTRIIEDLRRNATITVYETSLENKTTARDVVPDNETTTSNETTSADEQEDEETTTPTDTDGETTTQPVNEGFASCLADADATLYVVDWSPHSNDQLNEIGDAANEVNVVNCEDNRDECSQANITTYPTWTFDDTTRIEGYRTTTSLSQTLSCN